MRVVVRGVLNGIKSDTSDAEMLGVVKNTGPGRGMILHWLLGLDLDKTGVIAGISGRPVYVEVKLLGAVAYAWPYGNEPIAAMTPFGQMKHKDLRLKNSLYSG